MSRCLRAARIQEPSPSIGVRQHIASEIGDAVVDSAAHLGRQRQHAAQHLAQRSQIVLRDPLGQLQQMLAQQRLVVEHGFEVLHLEIRRRRDLDRRHHADQLLVAKRRDHARTPLRDCPCAHAIGERAIQRHRQRDFADKQASGATPSLPATPAARANRLRNLCTAVHSRMPLFTVHRLQYNSC